MPKNLFALVITIILAITGATDPAAADRRVALVIGNGAYVNTPTLPNPPNDGADVAAAFERLGFMVKRLINADFDTMRRGLIEFGQQARGADIAAVFFAGHGMEIGGENWLIPTDAELKSDTDIENESIALRSVMLQVSNASTLGLVILDACRNNPFAARIQRTAKVRAVGRGLSRIEPSDNVLVAYAARDGTTANDGRGRNSPFTTALLRHIETPGLEVTFLFRRVRDEVMDVTHREQQPFVYGSLSKDAIYLKPPQNETVAMTQQTPPAPTQPAPMPAIVQTTPQPPVIVARLSTGPVEDGAVGIWEMFMPNNRGMARWVWEILPNGTYRFRSIGRGAAPAHSGTIRVTDGRWTLRATAGLAGYEDGGPYEIKDANTLVMTGRLGTGIWHRIASPTASEGR